MTSVHPTIRTMESTIIPAISPILPLPVLTSSSFSPTVVVAIVVVADAVVVAAAVVKIIMKIKYLCDYV